MKCMKKFRIELHPSFAVGLGLLLALDPGNVLLPYLAAILLHELGHLFCLMLCGIPVRAVRIDFSGMVIQSGTMNRRQEGLCAAAGPFVNLLCSVLCYVRRPVFAACSMLLAVFNLLPVWPLDGGRMMAAIMPDTADTVSFLTLVLLCSGACLLSLFFDMGLWPLLLAMILLIKIAVNRRQEQKLFANHGVAVYNMQR